MDEGRINFFVLVNLLEMALYFILFGVLEFLLFLYVHPSIHPSIHPSSNMLIECCSQERTYLRYYGLLGQRFCLMDRRWSETFDR